MPARWTTHCGHPAAVFDAPARARFLDHLATTGNVRASAARAGVSRETVYRARRRYPDFARLWDAALVEARAHAAGELASYALEGVPQPVIVKGELVATWRRIDARLLLAHMARLDRFVEANPQAVHAAERFDALLAAHLGHEPSPLLRRAAEARCGEERRVLADLPASRAETVRYAAGCALDAPEGNEDALELACADAETEWDALAEEGCALVDAALNGAGEAAGEAPLEFKSRERGLGSGAGSRNGVASVNTGAEFSRAGRAPPSRCRAGSGRARSRRRG